MDKVIKAILTAIIGGGVLIASFYFAYLFLVIIVIAVLFGLAYLFFSWDELSGKDDYFD